MALRATQACRFQIWLYIFHLGGGSCRPRPPSSPLPWCRCGGAALSAGTLSGQLAAHAAQESLKIACLASALNGSGQMPIARKNRGHTCCTGTGRILHKNEKRQKKYPEPRARATGLATASEANLTNSLNAGIRNEVVFDAIN